MTATPAGYLPTGTVAVTLLVAVSITETLLLSQLVTYTFVPSGLTAIPEELSPTFNVAVTLFVAMSITETVSLSIPVRIYAYVPEDGVPCSVAADAADKKKIKNKLRAVNANATEFNFLPIFIILPQYLSSSWRFYCTEGSSKSSIDFADS